MLSDRNYLPSGMVYVMTNSAEKNEIAAFRRGYNGTLTLMGFFGTNGLGTGSREVSLETPNEGVDPLASQGSLVLSRDGRFLFAVNAGSHSISSFLVAAGGELTLADVVPSGGLQPNSLDSCGGFLYVSNVGSSENNYHSNIVGFRVNQGGKLAGIPGSTRNLSTINAQPSCVLFSPNGRQLAVSELTTDRISVFHIDNNGNPSGPVINKSSGTKPFGSSFLSSGGIFLVTEAGVSALSSYAVVPDGELRIISGSVPNGQMLACWVALTRDEQYAYTSNTGNGTITTYRINENGTLNVLGSIYSVPQEFTMAIDNGVSRDGFNFYVLNGNQGSISVFYICEYGRLQLLQVVNNAGLPILGTQGLAVR